MTRNGGVILWVVGAAVTMGCGGAQLVLKGPLTNQCVSAELEGCEDIAEGATLYADGNAAEGERKLARGLRANSGKAAELKKFAVALQAVGKIPGAGQYTAPIQPAVRLVLQIAQDEEQRSKLAARQKPEAEAAAPPMTYGASAAVATKPATSAQAVTPIEHIREPVEPPVSAFWMVAGNALSEPCRFVGTPKMLCMHDSIESPTLVSDIIISSGCPFDVVVMSHRGLEPDWAVYVPAGRGADLHAASLPMIPGRKFTVGVAYKADEPQPDMRCAVSTVWRPLHLDSERPKFVGNGMPALRTVIDALRAKAAAGKATAEDISVLRSMCREVGDSSCSK